MFFDQSEFDIRCEWGLKGVEALRDNSEVIIIVDVLSFSTCVDIATSNGAEILPYDLDDEHLIEFARLNNAIIASKKRSLSQYSLSPSSLHSITKGERFVLPSPNGSHLSLSTGNALTLAGCLRNAKAVAEYAASVGNTIAVIQCGEQWPDGSLRPALEDLIGAGAIISELQGSKSPEARGAESAFLAFKGTLQEAIGQCSSGKQLIERGCAQDVMLASKLNVSSAVPQLLDRAYVNMRE
jgi:2-phosphosulfolactate phosphatase